MASNGLNAVLLCQAPYLRWGLEFSTRSLPFISRIGWLAKDLWRQDLDRDQKHSSFGSVRIADIFAGTPPVDISRIFVRDPSRWRSWRGQGIFYAPFSSRQ